MQLLMDAMKRNSRKMFVKNSSTNNIIRRMVFSWILSLKINLRFIITSLKKENVRRERQSLGTSSPRSGVTSMWSFTQLSKFSYRLQLLLCQQWHVISLRHPATSSLGNIFKRLSCFSPTTTRTTHSWVTTSFLSLTSKHDLSYTYGDHISIRHSTMP